MTAAAQFNNYDELVKTVERWLARDDLTNDVKGFIHLAECDLQRTCRFRLGDKTATGTTVDGQGWIELPTDYAEGHWLDWTGDDTLPTLEIRSFDMMDSTQNELNQYNATVLRAGAVVGSRLYIGPIPGSVDYRLIYKAGVQHLGPDVPTNRILVLYPDALLFGALVASAPFLGDDARLATWTPLYQNAKEETIRAEERARYGPGALRMVPDRHVY